MRLYTPSILLVVVLFKQIYGESLNVTISADVPLNGEICVGQLVNFSCSISSDFIAIRHQWIVGNNEAVVGGSKRTVQVLSEMKITCIVTAIHKQDQLDAHVTARSSVVASPGGGVPVITFPKSYHNYVHYTTGKTANLTAEIMSRFPLTELEWLPPPYYSHPKNTTTTTRVGDVTTTVLSIPNIQIKNEGNYTVIATNRCGETKSLIVLDVSPDCPPELIAPPFNITAVENYNATSVCHFKGHYSFSLYMRAELPSGKLEWMWPGSDQCGCMLKNIQACSGGDDPDNCCFFNFVLTCMSPMNCNGTLFACDANFASNHTAHMTVLPSPKILNPPTNVSADTGSTVEFKCGISTTRDTSIAQIHWLYNGTDIEMYKRDHYLNATVTNNLDYEDYILSTLTIYSIEQSNAGEYSCYCSYDKTKLSVDYAGTIKSTAKSASLNVPDKDNKKIMFYVIVGIAIVLGVIVILLIFGALLYVRNRRKNQRRRGYEPLLGVTTDEFMRIGDDVLDLYVVEDLYPYWQKLGRKFKLSQSFLDDTFERFPANPAEQLRAVLHEWQARTPHATVAVLNRSLEELDLQDFIPRKRKKVIHHAESHPPDKQPLPVGGPGCPMFINRNSQILPGVDSQNAEVNTFKGTLRGGLPPLTVLSADLQAEWEELGQHFGLDLTDLRRVKEEKMSQTIACCMEVFVYWLTVTTQPTWDDFVVVLQEDPMKWNTIASGLVQHLNSVLVDSDGPSKQRRRRKKEITTPIQKHYAAIVENVDPEQLLVQLKTHDLVTPDEEYMLLNANLPPQRRTKLFLQRLCSKDPVKSVLLFYQCLKRETHHSGHEYLATLMEQDVCDYETKINNATEVPKKREKTNQGITLSSSPEAENDNLSEVLKSCWVQVAETIPAPPNMVCQITALSQDPVEQASLFLHRYKEHAGDQAKDDIIHALDQLGILYSGN